MKKFYLLLSAALLSAGVASAEAPTLTEVWQKYYTNYAFDSWSPDRPTPKVNWDNPSNIIDGNGSRTGIGMNGKVYTINCRTMSIMELSEEGMKDVYKLPSLKGDKFKFNEMTEAFTEQEADDYYGVLITRDDAGHFLVGHGFLTNAVPYLWSIYDPTTNKGKSFQVNFTGNGANTKYAMLRIDCVGRAMGNVLQDGGLVIGAVAYTWPTIYDSNTKTAKYSWAIADNVQRLKFINFYSDTENNTDVENVNAEGKVSEMIYLGSKQGTICQPLYNSVEEYNKAVEENNGDAMAAIEAGTFVYSKDAGGDTFAANKYALAMGTYNGGASVVNPFTNTAETDMGNNFSTFASFDTFVLQGERYYVATYQAEKPASGSSANNSFAVFNSKGMKVAVHSIEWQSVNGYCSISAEVIDDTTANIYLFGEAGGTTIPGVAAAGNYGVAGQYKFTVPAGGAGVADIAVDNEDAAPVYYNLQGVEVANPENGIYVVRRGSKVTKEIIR